MKKNTKKEILETKEPLAETELAAASDSREKKLEVRNLTVSFRTTGGKVQAVRDVSFDLYKGETLAVVGESGSGKSVTTRAVMGILAGNSIVESGEILYDGKDLLKISEEDFHKLRGDKIAMIFQDPMSSLNPIMKVGTQLTEAMLLKSRANVRESRTQFNEKLKALENAMNLAMGGDETARESNKKRCGDFDTFEYRHLALEKEYLSARQGAIEATDAIDLLLFEIEKNAVKRFKEMTAEIYRDAGRAVHEYVVTDENLAVLLQTLKEKSETIAKTSERYGEICETLSNIRDILNAALEKTEPNFFAMGYYEQFSGQPLPDMPTEELNAYLRKYLDDNFMTEFLACAQKALAYSEAQCVEAKRALLPALNAAAQTFGGDFDKKTAYALVKEVSQTVIDSVNPLDLVKDSSAFTFRSSLKSAVDRYFDGVAHNSKEQARFDKDTAKYEKLAQSGKEPDFKVVPANIIDLELAKSNISRVIERLKESSQKRIDGADKINFAEKAVAMVDFFKEKASGVVNKVTKAIARHRALKLLEEVGIPEPHKRFNQYPFEFSGGMRQRIVIAIALAANPDILICDEPTTALDVTIQSQILELINRIKAERNLTVIFITHDLGVVANMADRIAVMYAGKIVEAGTDEDVFYRPAHPYTWALLSSMPDLDTSEKLEAIPGTPPNMIFPPQGDAFAPRNKYALKIDFEMQPPMFKISDTHYAATWLLHPDAPKVEMPKIVSDRIKRMSEVNKK
jgi:oligopeptide/dipeptide ABC transporter ATP-binding protein